MDRFERVDRTLPRGEHPFTALLPMAAKSPALRRIAPLARRRTELLSGAVVRICGPKGYAFVDVTTPAIVLSERYYRSGDDLDLYLDLLHELTHLRQIGQGYDLWDERFDYVDRPTEVEAYAVAVEEGRRLGMTEGDVLHHLTNPWMTKAQVLRLLGHIDTFLGGGPLPNQAQALVGAPFKVHHPWRCPRLAPVPRRPKARACGRANPKS